MKDLEAAAASLEPVQRRLAHAEDLLVDTNLVCHCGLLHVSSLGCVIDYIRPQQIHTNTS